MHTKLSLPSRDLKVARALRGRIFFLFDAYRFRSHSFSLSTVCSSNLAVVVIVVVVVVIGSLSARGHSSARAHTLFAAITGLWEHFSVWLDLSRPKPVRRRSDTGQSDSWPPRSSAPATGTARADACGTASPARCSCPVRRCFPTRFRSRFPR